MESTSKKASKKGDRIRSSNTAKRSSSSVYEYLDAIRQDYKVLETSLSQARADIQRLVDRNSELQGHYKSYFDMSYHLNLEWHKETEVNNRLTNIITSLLPDLSEELRTRVQEQVERARVVSMSDIEARISGEAPATAAAVVNAPPIPRQPTRSVSVERPDKRAKTAEVGETPEGSATSDETTAQLMNKSVVLYEVPASTSAGETRVPRTAAHMHTFRPPDIVSAIALSKDSSHVFTGHKGTVMLWSVEEPDKPVSQIQWTDGSHYARAAKITDDGNTLIVAGESSILGFWSIREYALHSMATVSAPFTSLYAVACTPDSKSCITCAANGSVVMWDIESATSIREFKGHADSVTCADITADGKKLITGGLDRTLRIWDIDSAKLLGCYMFASDIYCLAACPISSHITVGLHDDKLEVLNVVDPSMKYQLALHSDSILSVKYARSGSWFLSTGKDQTVVAWKGPMGGSLFQAQEPSSVLCSDIARDDSTFVTGSGHKLACVYKLQY